MANVYDKGTTNKLVVFSRATNRSNVSEAGKDKWEELSIGLTAKVAVDIEVVCENTSTTAVFFDNLEVKWQAVPTVLVVQENHYMPFGLGMKGLDWTLNTGKENKFQYNDGTEKNTDFELNWYETDYRPYDVQISRMTGVHALADEFTGITPYNYAFNNPIVFNDPTGSCPECEKKYEGQTVENGTSYVSDGGALYSYNEGQWTREGGMMAEVTVTGEKDNTSEAVYNFFEYTGGVAEAINSNFYLGFSRKEPTSQANASGQFLGDMISTAASVLEIGLGAGGTGVGAATSWTGVGAVVATGSVAVAAHGAYALGNSAANLQGSYLRFAKKYSKDDFNDGVGGFESYSKDKKKPKANNINNGDFDAAMRKLGITDPNRMEKAHDLISGQGLKNMHEIVDYLIEHGF